MLRNEKGMTLIELLASVVILGILVVAFSNISRYLFHTESAHDRSVDALALAGEITNVVRSEVASGAAALTYDIRANPLTGSTVYPAGGGKSYAYRITRHSYDPASAPPAAASVPGAHQRSLESILLLTDAAGSKVPEWMTVTVSWEDDL